MTNSSSQRRALVVQNNFSPFGNKLVQSGYVNTEQMQQSLVESRKTGRPLLDILESLTGQHLSPDLIRQYKKQQLFELKILYGVESLDPEVNQIPTNKVGDLIDTLVPIDMCRRHSLVPLSKSDTEPPSVLIAMVNPDNLTAQDDLNRVLRPKGFALQRLVITREDFQRIISAYLDEQVERQKQVEQQEKVDIQSDLESLGYLDLEEASEEADTNLDVADAEAPLSLPWLTRSLLRLCRKGCLIFMSNPRRSS